MGEEVNAYLLIGLSMLVGFVFGYAACLWRWTGAEEARQRQEAETRAQEQAEAPPRSFTEAWAKATAHPGFKVAHDCVQEKCRTPHGGVR